MSEQRTRELNREMFFTCYNQSLAAPVLDSSYYYVRGLVMGAWISETITREELENLNHELDQLQYGERK